MFSLKKIRHLPKPIIYLITGLVNCLSKTFRLSISDPNLVLTKNYEKPAVYICWHNRLLCLPSMTPERLRNKIAVLISLSRDGNYINDLIQALKFQVIRGSSSKGGKAALGNSKNYLLNGGSLMVTPDGPRGPKYKVQTGVIWMASLAKVPIIPVSLNTKSHWKLKSWDRTQIPKPFTKAELIIGEPIVLGEDLDRKKIKEYQKLVSDHLMAVTHWD